MTDDATVNAVIRRLLGGWTPWPDQLEWAGFRGSEPMTLAEAELIRKARSEA